MVSETLMWKEQTMLPHLHGGPSREAKPRLEPPSLSSASPLPTWRFQATFLSLTSGCSGSDWRLLGSPSYSEASDSWEWYFSEISVTLITGPLRFFFFREGILERPDLEAATGTQRVGEGRIESHIHETFGVTVPHTPCIPVLGFWGLTGPASGLHSADHSGRRQVQPEGGRQGRVGSQPGILAPLGLGTEVCQVRGDSWLSFSGLWLSCRVTLASQLFLPLGPSLLSGVPRA